MDPTYLEYAQKNIIRNDLQSQIQLIDSHGNFFNGVVPKETQADFIISNPPYYDIIRSPKFLWGGRTHELVGTGDSGEGFIVRMIQEGWSFLKTPGVLAFIIPKTRQDTLIAIESFIETLGIEFDIFGLCAGNRTRFVFRLYKKFYDDSEFVSETQGSE
jgi:methylase of polypeptide subunit release factors